MIDSYSEVRVVLTPSEDLLNDQLVSVIGDSDMPKNVTIGGRLKNFLRKTT